MTSKVKLYLTPHHVIHLLPLISILLAWKMLINHDAAIYLSYAELLMNGKQFYTDIIEANTPLTAYLSLIPVLLSDWTNISIINSFFLCVGLLAIISSRITYTLMIRHPNINSSKNRILILLMIYGLLFLFPTVLREFGQREHLFIICIFPYIALLTGYAQDVSFDMRHKITVGLLAGIGFSLKPHFIVLFAFAELAWLIFHRRWLGMFRIDSVLIGSIFVIYHICVILFFPECFDTLPIFMEAYAGFQAPLSFILIKIVWYLSPLYFFLILAYKKKTNIRLVAIFTALIAASTLLYIVPLTDYYYHLIPMHTLMLWFAVVITLSARLYKLCIALMILWVTPAISLVKLEQKTIMSVVEKITPLVQGEDISILSSSVHPGFPILNYAGAKWKLPVAHQIHLPGAYMNARGTHAEPNYRTMDEMDETERFFTERTIIDLESLPKLIIFDKRPETQAFLEMKFDMQTYYMKQPRFQKLWKHYDYVDTVSDFAIYQRKD